MDKTIKLNSAILFLLFSVTEVYATMPMYCGDKHEFDADYAFGIQLNNIQVVTPSVTAIAGFRDSNCFTHGLVFKLRPGLLGGILNVGYGMMNSPVSSYTMSLSVLKTWLHTVFYQENQTLLGINSEITIMGRQLSLAIYRNTNRDKPDKWAALLGIGLGI